MIIFVSFDDVFSFFVPMGQRRTPSVPRWFTPSANGPANPFPPFPTRTGCWELHHFGSGESMEKIAHVGANIEGAPEALASEKQRLVCGFFVFI